MQLNLFKPADILPDKLTKVVNKIRSDLATRSNKDEKFISENNLRLFLKNKLYLSFKVISLIKKDINDDETKK